MNVVKRDYHFKLIFTGDISAGKTCLTKAFGSDSFDPNTLPTMDMITKTVEVDGSKIEMRIWDTNGQIGRVCGPLARDLLRPIYRGVQGVIMVYDVTRSQTFSSLNEFLEEVEKYGPDGVYKLIVGTKSDLSDKRQVDFASAKKFADELDIPIMEASAKSKNKVDEIFFTIARNILEKIRV